MSIHARYLQLLLGEENVPFPEDGYHGDDIRELAQAFYDLHGDQYRDVEEAQRLEALAAFGLERNIPKMQADLRRYGIEYDQWFFESSLHTSGYVAETVGLLTEKGWTYEKDGALWLNTTQLLKNKYLAEGKSQKQVDKLDLKDDVLRRANGFYTYFAADIAYHRNKLEVRGFDKSHRRVGGRSPRSRGPAPGRPGRAGPGRLPPAGGGAHAAGEPSPGRAACADVQAVGQGHRPARPAG